MTKTQRMPNLFWDTCVFARYLTRQPTEMLGDIDQYVADARDNKYVIYCSTLVFLELRPRLLRPSRFATPMEFIADLGSAFVPIDPNPNIMAYAGAMRDHEPVNPSDPHISEERKRSIGTPDAIHLATCLHLRDVMGLNDIAFHTFDEGKGANWAGRCVPIIGFERWYPPDRPVREIADVCNLPRRRPQHPSPDLATRALTHADATVSQPSS
jgi:predicted nucleic acid-binding protein